MARRDSPKRRSSALDAIYVTRSRRPPPGLGRNPLTMSLLQLLYHWLLTRLGQTEARAIPVLVCVRQAAWIPGPAPEAAFARRRDAHWARSSRPPRQHRPC